MHQTIFKRSLIAVTVTSAMGIPGLAAAQSGVLEEVVVTAQKREETNQEIPISITALTSSALEKRGIQNTGDLIGEIPAVGGFESPGARGTTGLSMRGVAGGSPANLSVDPAVAIYLDGVYIGKQLGSAMDVAEIERVEVLRGPQGTLYGRNSTGGAVNFITRKPSGEFGVRAIGTVGDYDHLGLKLNVDLPAIGEVGDGLGELAASLGFQTREQDGFADNDSPGGDDFDDLDRQAWRLALTWNLTESLYADYTYDHSELDESNALEQVVGFTPVDPGGFVDRIPALQGTLAAAQGWAAIPGTDPRISSRWIPSLERTIAAYEAAEAQGEGREDNGRADFSPSSDNEVDGHALTVTWEAGDLGAPGDVTFKSISAYRDMDTYVFGDLEDIDSRLDANGIGAYQDLVHLTLAQLYGPSSGFPYPLVDNVWAGIDDIGAFHSKQDTTSEYDQFSQELQMVGATDRLEYVLGLYYFEDEGDYERLAIFAAPVSGEPSQVYEIETEAWAVFGQATWTPGWLEERLSFTAGLRYTEEDKSIDYDYGEVISPFSVTPAMAVSRKENFDNISGNFTAAFQATDDVNVFVRYATGYRSGGFNGEAFDNPYDEEDIEQLEIGIKSDWWDRRLRINASLYTYAYNDLQVSTILTQGGTASTQILNAGEADRWGGELEMLVAPIDDLILGLSYAHINGDFDEYPDVCGTNVPQTCLDGQNRAKRTSSPDNQVNLFADYVFARTSFGEITGYLQVNWQDEWIETALWQGVVAGEPVIYDHLGMDERTIVNARLGLEEIEVGNGTMRVTLWGKNLTDDDYPVYGINFGPLGILTEQYGKPRTYGVEIAYEY